MTFCGRRATTLLAGAAATAALLLSGCGTGQVAETANKVAAVPGTSGDIRTEEGLLSVRNAVVVYDGPEGYQTGASAPLDVRIFNDTQRAVTVRVSSPAARSVALSSEAEDASPSPSESPSESASPSASASPTESASPTGSASPSGSPSESASPSPAATPARPASIQIAAGEYVVLTEQAGEYLRLVGLNEELKPGQTVELTFDFGGGHSLTLPVPVGIPLSPAPRASAELGEEEGH